MKKPNIMNVRNLMRNLYQNARPLFQPKVNGGGATYAKTEYR